MVQQVPLAPRLTRAPVQGPDLEPGMGLAGLGHRGPRDAGMGMGMGMGVDADLGAGFEAAALIRANQLIRDANQANLAVFDRSADRIAKLEVEITRAQKGASLLIVIQKVQTVIVYVITSMFLYLATTDIPVEPFQLRFFYIAVFVFVNVVTVIGTSLASLLFTVDPE